MQNREVAAIKKLLIQEEKRAQQTLCLIASENFVSKSVREVLSSTIINKYAEGVAHKRHYPGCKILDKIEEKGEGLAKRLFHTEGANLQPYSGSIANLIAFRALLKKGDRVLAMHPADGGHSTHATKMNISGDLYKTFFYRVNKDGLLDYELIRKAAKKCKPKLIIAGSSYYPQEIDYKAFSDIAKETGSLFLADIAHPAGLIAAGLHNSPAQYADVITSTTHKTLRGPRGGLIMYKKQYKNAISEALYPGVQGGPLMNIVAAKAVALAEALQKDFIDYQKRVIQNSKTLCSLLMDLGFSLYTNGSANHLILIDLKSIGIDTMTIEKQLESINITSNALPIPGRDGGRNDGLRIGTAAITTLNPTERDLQDIALILFNVIVKRDIPKAYKIQKALIKRINTI